MESIEINPQFEQVLNFVNQTNQLIFLTGKAGTGKTTLLKYIKKNTFKQMSIVAPTGVAAINAGGSTIHSFFQFPFTPFLPNIKENGEIDATKSNLPALKYNSQRLAIFRNLELLVIDEISMVRADLLDQIDITLRQTRRKWNAPFGGVQVMFIGDMYQLPPVVQNEEWKFLGEIYQNPYFFESLVIRKHPPVYIELEKIYRQKEDTFINLLNKVRNNNLDNKSLQLLNSHYKQSISDVDYQNNITLTTHNRKADEINSRNLNALKEKSFSFKCKVEGNFSEKSFPADEVLVLKKGTRVMFLKNNAEKNYYNGKIGVISFIDENKIKVKCDEDTAEIDVSKEVWTNISYKVDRKTKRIDEEILGTFSQYPLRLAWAITIHKSQGLTFDKLIIDAAESFSAGQVYVALSRCRSLKGLTLSTQIQPQSLMNDKHILGFSAGKHNLEQVNALFNSAQRDYMLTILFNIFDYQDILLSRKELASTLILHQKHIQNEGKIWSDAFFSLFDSLNDVSLKFKNQLEMLTQTAANIEMDEKLQTRLQQAVKYFDMESSKLIDSIKNCNIRTESKEAANDLNEILQRIFEGIFLKHSLLKTCEKGFKLSEYIQLKLKISYPDFKINVYATSKNSKVSADAKYPDLYRKLIMLRDTICNEDEKPIYLVANSKTLLEMTNFLPQNENQLLKISGFGNSKVNEYGERFLDIIKTYIAEHDIEPDSDYFEKKKDKKVKKEKVTTESSDTKTQSFALLKQGLQPKEIAQKRGFALSTIEGHLIPFIASGEIDINTLVSKEKQQFILDALQNFDAKLGINPVKASLPNDISYSEIRYMIAHKLHSSH
jgi:hypothetical protein